MRHEPAAWPGADGPGRACCARSSPSHCWPTSASAPSPSRTSCRAGEARPRPAAGLCRGALQRGRRGPEGPAARHGARGHGQQRGAVRRLRRPGRAPGRPGAREPAEPQVRQRRARGGAYRPGGEGAGAGGGPAAQAGLADDEARCAPRRRGPAAGGDNRFRPAGRDSARAAAATATPRAGGAMAAAFSKLQKPGDPVALQSLCRPARAAHGCASTACSPTDVRVVPAAAGGPKGLVLLPLDRFLFGRWLPQATHPCTCWAPRSVRGAWPRLPARPDAALAAAGRGLRDPGLPARAGSHARRPRWSRTFGARLVAAAAGPRGRGAGASPLPAACLHQPRPPALLHRRDAWRTPLGWAGPMRPTLQPARPGRPGWSAWCSATRATPLPLPAARLPQPAGGADPHNLAGRSWPAAPSPFALAPVQDVPGGPRGHLLGRRHHRLPPAPALCRRWRGPGAVPALPARGRARLAGQGLDAPPRHAARWTTWCCWRRHPDWMATLPHAKLPDRNDFKSYGDDIAGRERVWRRAVAESERLADEFAELVVAASPVDALPLALTTRRGPTGRARLNSQPATNKDEKGTTWL
jgi:hypothetical protein